MRLTCPNCAAQYEVPDDVIPDDGRDVQCSNCGQTWFQPAAGSAAADAEGEPAPEQAPQPEPAPAAPEETAPPAVPPQPPQEAPAAAAPGAEPGLADLDELEELEDLPPPQEARAKRNLDPDLSEILREEAEREASLRAAESNGLETQPELGLAPGAEDEAARRARQARDRMARMRGEDPRQIAAAESGSRRELLPDIEEINSTLRAGEAAAAPAPQATESRQPPRKSGFARGFALAVLAVLVLVMVYDNAPLIAAKLPGADPYLSSYVASVDQARLWLDAQVKALAAAE
ncbi:zinc-ribbon domain-containing protein [Roseobacteraceae bacterium NS-SX3]